MGWEKGERGREQPLLSGMTDVRGGSGRKRREGRGNVACTSVNKPTGISAGRLTGNVSSYLLRRYRDELIMVCVHARARVCVYIAAVVAAGDAMKVIFQHSIG